jgi:hypothetical protein
MYKGAMLSVASTSTRLVGSNVVVRDGTWDMSGGEPAEGEAAAPQHGLYTVISVKQDGEWRIAAHRTRVPATPPTSSQE